MPLHFGQRFGAKLQHVATISPTAWGLKDCQMKSEIGKDLQVLENVNACTADVMLRVRICSPKLLEESLGAILELHTDSDLYSLYKGHIYLYVDRFSMLRMLRYNSCPVIIRDALDALGHETLDPGSRGLCHSNSVQRRLGHTDECATAEVHLSTLRDHPFLLRI